MKKLNSAGFSHRSKGNTKVIGLLFAVLVISVLLLLANFIYLNIQTGYDNQYAAHTGELRVLSQGFTRNASEAMTGNEWGFGDLERTRENFAQHWSALRGGDEQSGLPPAPEVVQEAMNKVEDTWGSLEQNVQTVLASEKIATLLGRVGSDVMESLPRLQVDYEEVVEILLTKRAPLAQVTAAQQQLLLVERILTSVSRLMAGQADAAQASDRFARDTLLFSRILRGMLDGDSALDIPRISDNEAREHLQRIVDEFQTISDSVEQVISGVPELIQGREAVDNLYGDSQKLLDDTTGLSAAFAALAQTRQIHTWLGGGLAALIVLSLVLIGIIALRSSNQRLEEIKERNERNQAAIWRLLEEMDPLTDGDLTVTTTVTEDFTGTIADSINQAIEQLRDVVAAINQISLEVASAAQETQATADNLAEASDHQAQEIAGVSAAINQMTQSINQVSTNASESAAVAERSVAIASRGSEVVQSTITGMDNIREQIQDTSKRLKRLGESSQEIGDIISLIDDIADQTNILALNAAIQAAMAGEAGRGFAVVADEVQRLAERSQAATKQIEGLVRTIQTDTHEAVISMEQTTAEVVQGANLAQNAGVALKEIEQVSQNLAALIEDIYSAARQQASSATHISSTMRVIQDITSQTSTGTATTAQSIGSLAEMAAEMRRSVSGFKLPEAA